MAKQWVFEKLVTDPHKGVVGLIAYALYKARKHEVASSLRESGRSEEEIKEQVDSYHESVVNSPSTLSDFKSNASRLLDDVTAQLEQGIAEHYQKQLERKDRDYTEAVERLKREYEKKLNREVKKGMHEFVKKIHAAPVRPKTIRALCWIWNGFSGVFAATLLAMMIGGIVYHSLPAEQKNEAIANSFNRWINSTSSLPSE